MEERVRRASDMQLSERASDELIAKLRTEATEAQAEVVRLSNELKVLQAEFDNVRGGGPDFAYPAVEVPLLPDDAVYTVSAASPQTILTVGSQAWGWQHNDSAESGRQPGWTRFQNLLVELDSNLPMLNAYFEFTHIPYGFEECVNSIANGKIEEVNRAIIRPAGLSSGPNRGGENL